jgi:hypothetical protein
MSVEAFLMSLASDLLEHFVPFEGCFLLPGQLSDIELPIVTVHVDRPMYRLNSTKNRNGEPIQTSLYCYGIFDRAESCLEEKNLGNLLDDHEMLLNDILNHYKLRIPSTEDILRASGISLSDT